MIAPSWYIPLGLLFSLFVSLTAAFLFNRYTNQNIRKKQNHLESCSVEKNQSDYVPYAKPIKAPPESAQCFKSNSALKQASDSGQQTLYFKNGQLLRIVGNQDNWYDPKYIVSDGKKYDVESVDGIRSVQIPRFVFSDFMSGYGVTGSLDYVLRMKAANLREKGLIEESDACYRKAIALMKCSGVPYDMTPYLYFAKDLLREGRFEESEAEEEKIYKLFHTTRSIVNSNPDVRPYITQEDREYYRIKYLLPNVAPKSISGYTRMKKENTPNFQKIYAAATSAGITINAYSVKK